MRAGRFILTSMLIVLTAASALVAQTSQPATNLIHRTSGISSDVVTPSSSSKLINPDIGHVAMSLAAVLCLILVLRFLLRRMGPGAMSRSSRGIRVITRTYLAPKQQVMVLQVGRRLLIVGDSGHNLSTLCEISDPDEAATLLAQIQGKSFDADKNSFVDAMSRASEPFAQKPTDPLSDPALESARTELNGLAQRVRTLSRHLNRA